MIPLVKIDSYLGNIVNVIKEDSPSDVDKLSTEVMDGAQIDPAPSDLGQVTADELRFEQLANDT